MTRPAALAVAAALALLAAAVRPSDEDARGAPADCAAPPALATIGPFQAHVAARLARGDRLTIVAVGSSSTQGVGASAPELSYPSRLEAELKERLPDRDIRVVNRGKSGEDAPEELARLGRDVVAEHPDLVIWQLGTNAVLRRDDFAADDRTIRRGLAMLRQNGSDVVLMDLQYAPRVIARRGYPAMERLIAEAAQRADVGLFRRFAIMRQWQAAPPPDAPKMVGPDGLHMSDAGYGCLASDLAAALAANWWSQQKTARPLTPAAPDGASGTRHAAAAVVR